MFSRPKTICTFILACVVVMSAAQTVGLTAGSADVNDYGAATYTIPIKVPSGTNDFDPTLNLNYNSQRGNGIAGYGWMIGGLSAITRGNQDFCHDNIVLPANIMIGTPFMLDGIRLCVKSGSYGASGATYGMEYENYSVITSSGSVSGCTACPQYFTIKTKAGWTLEYGNTADSRIATSNGMPVMWLVDKVSDNSGNYIEYKYVNTDGQPRIDQINYTGNTTAGVSPYNKIKFNYVLRSDPNVVYAFGSGTTYTAINNKYVLDNIVITGEGGVAVKSYQCAYTFNGRYSLLSSLTEKGSDGVALNPTTFTYGSSETSLNTAYDVSLDFPSAADILYGDFDGDGATELFAANYTPGSSPKIYTSYSVYKYAQNTYTQIASGTLPSSENGATIYASLGTGDFNGDGKMDVVLYKKTSATAFNSIRILYGASGAAFTSVDYVVNASISFNSVDGVVGDFDGDGRSDIITRVSASVFNLHFPGRNEFNNVLQDNTTVLLQQLANNNPKITDVDGDGKNELADDVGDIYSITKIGSIYTPVLNTAMVNQQLFGQGDKSNFGDFNGDGKKDVLISYSNAFLSTGNQYLLTSFTLNPTAAYTKDYQLIRISDLNGDGKEDIVHFYKKAGYSDIGIDAYVSNGISFTKYNIYNGSSPTAENIFVMNITDVNGDGIPEIILSDVDNQIVTFHIDNKIQSRLLSTVTNGYGESSVFAYSNLSNTGTVPSFPLINIIPGKYVVTRLLESVAQSQLTDLMYSYSSPVFHKQGLGFLGFAQIRQSNQLSGLTIEKNCSFSGSPFYLRLLNTISVKDGSGAAKSSKTYTVTPVNLTPFSSNNRRVLITTTQLVEQDINGGVKTTGFTIDNTTGNITKKIVNDNNIETTTTNYSNFCTTCGTSVPSLPQSVSTVITRTGSPANFTDAITNVYDGKGRATKKTEFDGKARPVITDRTYDNFGNVLTQKITSGNDSRSEAYTYKTNGRSWITYKNPLGETTTANTFDARWGFPTKITDFTGRHTTTYAYDALSRNVSSIPSVANGQTAYSITKALAWSAIANSKYAITTTTTGLAPVTEYYDALDRLVRTERSINGNLQFHEWNYDSKGDVVTEKVNSANGGMITTNNTYDQFHRLISSSTPVKNISTSFTLMSSGGTLTATNTTSGQPVKITTTDGTGKIVRVEEKAGSISTVNIYTYHANGNLYKVNQNGLDVATCAYDEYGNQTQLIDKDAGSNIYMFNGFSQLVKQTDARNNITELSYETTTGRLSQKKVTDAGNANAITTTTYTYIPNGTSNGANKLLQASSTAGITELNSYDAFDRLLSNKKTFESNNYITTYEYGNFDRLNSITYPAAPGQTAFKVIYSYSADGYVTKVDGVNNGVTKNLFSASNANYNAFDQVKQYTLANGVTSTAGYDDFGNMTSLKASKIFYPVIQDLSMQYYDGTKNFNLWKRTDNVITAQRPAALTETFDYDIFGRLTSLQTGNSSRLISYDNTGNIAAKFDAGSEYNYNDPLHTHGVAALKSKVYNGPGYNDPQTEPCDISREEQNISYTAFNQPWVITQSSAPAPDAPIQTKQLTYTYGLNNQRIKSVYKVGTTTQYSRYFFGNMEYEKDGSGAVVRQVYYAYGPTGMIAMLVREAGTTDKYYIPYKDNLGSIVTVTDESGNKIAEQSFDAWGRQRNPNDWSYTGFTPIGTGTTKWLYRGYTGHEHLPQFDLVNMNGRLYDPIAGRMLSPDNLVHDPFQTQAFNRYSYVWNQPTKFTDPSGEDGWDDYDDDGWGRDEDERDYENEVPDGYHVENGELYQDVFVGPDGSLYENILAGSWDNGADSRSWNDFEREGDDRDYTVEDEPKQEDKNIYTDHLVKYIYLIVEIGTLNFDVSYQKDKDDHPDVLQVTSHYDGFLAKWEPRNWEKGKSGINYFDDGSIQITTGGNLTYGQYGISHAIDVTLTINKAGVIEWVFH